MHAGTWPAEQTDPRSLYQEGPSAISGLAKGPEEQQGRWGLSPCDLRAWMALTWGPKGGVESQRTLGTFSELEVVQRKLLNKNQVSLTE